MAKRSATNVLAGQVDIQKAMLAHKHDETDYGSAGDLPAGIENGIAELTSCKFDLYKSGDFSGKPYFSAAATVISPRVHDGIKVEGKFTRIGPEPIVNTPSRSRKTIDEHMQWVLNELRKLGVSTADLNDVGKLELVTQALEQQKPKIVFRTWKGDATPQFPNPRVSHQWGGLHEGVVPEVSDDVVDNTEPTPDAPVQGAPEDGGEEDLISLGIAADAGDDVAQAKLEQMFEEAGLNPDDYSNWLGMAEALVGADSGGESSNEGNGANEPVEPAKGETWMYQPPRMKSPVECEVTAVFAGKRTVNLKNAESGAMYKSVSWDDLS